MVYVCMWGRQDNSPREIMQPTARGNFRRKHINAREEYSLGDVRETSRESHCLSTLPLTLSLPLTSPLTPTPHTMFGAIVNRECPPRT